MPADTASRREDRVFKALADPTRRLLLDRLREHNGQTLGELCGPLAMTRQSATQHVALLEQANLVNAVRRGREKHHYLNPVPIHEIGERWIDKFELPRLRALGAIRHRAEDGGDPMTDEPMTREPLTDRPTFVYVTYIESTPEQVWHALTDAEVTAAYWGHANVSDWQVGSRWEHRRTDGSAIADVAGTVVESDPPARLVCTWGPPEGGPPGDVTRVTFEIEPHGAIVRLTVTHEDLTAEGRREVGHGWPAVMANLKSLLETGHVLPEAPWTMAPRPAA